MEEDRVVADNAALVTALTRLHGGPVLRSAAQHAVFRAHAVSWSPSRLLNRCRPSLPVAVVAPSTAACVAVARLRTKLERDSRFPVFLQTVRGKGWMLRTN